MSQPAMLKTPSKKGPATKPKPKVPNGSKDPVEVYCRLRPLKNDNDCVCIKRLNDNTLQLIPFGNNKLESFYTFKHVFPEDTTQKQLFDRIGLPLIRDLINGKNGLLFTYGITSSGKTFTVTGNSQDCGLLPRTLDVLFNSVEDSLSRKFVFKPDAQNGFTIRSTPDALLEWQKEKQIARTPSSITSTPRVKRRDNDELKEWDQRERDENKIDIDSKGNAFAIFVSYVEIYNNYIYDLLDEEIIIDSHKLRQPQSKVLREDKRRRVFVWLAKEVEVTSADEAFDLFVKGVRRRRMAHTALNTESSRSHSVFNIKVVQAPLDSGGEVIQDEKFLTVSQLSLVDLAGSERTQRTQNIGERLREAGNINNSLMALRNCIELLRENQKFGVNKMIPYRDNKLTHLFKSYFEGEGKIKMVLCVNPGSEDFDETLHVMKFAETAQEVLINRANDIPFHLKMPHPYSSSKFIPYPNVESTPVETIGPPLPLISNIDFRDKKQTADLIEILELRKKNTLRHFEHIRQKQMLFRESLISAENENMLTKQQLQIIRNDLEVREGQVKTLESKCCQLEGDQEEYMRKIYGLERHLREIEEQLDRKNQALSHAGVENQRTKAVTEERIAREKERLKRIFERVLKEKQAQLEREQCLTKEKMHLVKEILTADNSDWGLFRDYWDSMYPTTPTTGNKNINTGNSNTGGSTSFHIRRPSVPEAGSRTLSTATPEILSTPSSSKRLKLASEPGTSTLSTPSVIHKYPDLTRENIENRARTKSSPGVPVVNPRHIRSLSTGNEKWIDHRPQADLDMGTILTPKIKNKISVSNLKNIDTNDLRRVSKYAITTHLADEMGDVETRIYKGEVIPSSLGGAQVIFNDVETMVQSSPRKP